MKSQCMSLVITVQGLCSREGETEKGILSIGMIKQAMMMGGGQVRSLFPVSPFKGLEEQKVLAECWDVSGGTLSVSESMFLWPLCVRGFFLLFVLDL